MIGNRKSAEVTSFAERVYALISTIPAGRVATYGEVARALGCGSPRAVGQALRRNPRAPEVPCHRVLAADGRLGGYSGAVAGEPLARKVALLEAEGVVFGSPDRVDLSRCEHRFP